MLFLLTGHNPSQILPSNRLSARCGMGLLLNLPPVPKKMNMRFSLLSFSLVLVYLMNGLTAQAQQTDKRLNAAYSKKELAEMSKNDAGQLAYLSFYLDNGYQIVDVPKGKEEGVKETVNLKSLDPKDINLLALKLPQHEFARQYYLIPGTGKMLVHLPKSEVEAAFKKASK